jgi:phosphoglycolate phosphatase-like HAD superfamily hydrolase
MVGDAETDVAAGKAVGCRTALITQSERFQQWAQKPDIWAESLALAAQRILGQERGVGRTDK